jgi:hypothetical protein
MWVVDNNTPLPVERCFLRDRDGGEIWIVVVRGTFDVVSDDRVRSAEVQVPPARAAAWTGEPGASSLRHDTDLVLPRNGTDVLVHGHAYAPRGRAAPSVDLVLKVGSRAKRVRVHGVRAWMRSLTSSAIVPGPALPFERLPLAYEDAFGGTDTAAPPGKPSGSASNPVGVGFSHTPATLVDVPAPRIEAVDEPLRAGPFDLPAAGFGPIAPHWSSRSRFGGTYDKTWQATRAPLPPKDFDERFWRSAPPDQQLDHFLDSGARIELSHFTPDGFLAVTVPDVRFTMRVIFTDGEAEVRAVLHTAVLEPDDGRVQFVWHASYPCHGRDHKLTRAIVNWEGDRSCLLP